MPFENKIGCICGYNPHICGLKNKGRILHVCEKILKHICEKQINVQNTRIYD